jgi:hypothetical protein
LPVRGDLAGDEVWVGLGRGGKGLGWGGIKFAGVWANAGYCGWMLEVGVGVGMTPGNVCSLGVPMRLRLAVSGNNR